MSLEDIRLKSVQIVQPTIAHSKPKQEQLSDLNLEEEVLLNYKIAKHTLEDLDDETPANQKAQVINSITSILKDLVKMQTELYDAERVKKMEACLIQVLKTLPDAQQDEFFEIYGESLKAL
jgi:hypothetical protein